MGGYSKGSCLVHHIHDPRIHSSHQNQTLLGNYAPSTCSNTNHRISEKVDKPGSLEQVFVVDGRTVANAVAKVSKLFWVKFWVKTYARSSNQLEHLFSYLLEKSEKKDRNIKILLSPNC